MIFRNALLREFTRSAIAVFIVLFGIMLSTQLVRLLGAAAKGTITLESIFMLLTFVAFGALPVLLSLTLFLSILLTLTRSYRDSEMVVWFSAGQGLTAWIRPVLVFALPLVALIALLSFVLSPWAMQKSDQFQRDLSNRDDISRIAPGVFQEARRDDRVFFVEQTSAQDKTVSNVFVSSVEHQRLGIMVAQHGRVDTAPNGDRFIVLLNGRRYEGTPGTADYRVAEFGQYSMRIEQAEDKLAPPPAKALATPILLQQPNSINLAEFSWRVGQPLLALVLSLLAIPLSFVNPRAGRSLNLFIAAFIYMIYSNCASISQAWIAQDKLSFFVGLWLVHAVMIVLLVFLFYRRLSLRSIPRLSWHYWWTQLRGQRGQQ